MNPNLLKQSAVTIGLLVLLPVQLYAECDNSILRNITVPVDTTINCSTLSGVITCESPKTSVLENLTIADNTEIVNCKIGKNVVFGKDIVFSDTQDLQAQTCRVQQIDIKTIPDTTFSAKVKGEVLTLVTTGGTSGNPINVTVTTPKICRLQGDKIRLLKEGDCRLTATQAGDAQYGAANPFSYTIHVQSKQPTFNFSQETDSSFKLEMTVAAEDVGKPAIVHIWSDRLVSMGPNAVFKDGRYYRPMSVSTLNANDQWVSWSGDPQYLAPTDFIPLLPTGAINFSSIPATINYLVGETSLNNLHATYRLIEDERITIPNESEITPEQVKTLHCLSQPTGVLSQGRCFQAKESLGDGFYGGLYLVKSDHEYEYGGIVHHGPEELDLPLALSLECSSTGQIAMLIRLEAAESDIGQPFEIAGRAQKVGFGYYEFWGGSFGSRLYGDLSEDETEPAKGFILGVYDNAQKFSRLPPIFMSNAFLGKVESGSWLVYFGYRTVVKKDSYGEQFSEWRFSTKPLAISVGERCY